MFDLAWSPENLDEMPCFRGSKKFSFLSRSLGWAVAVPHLSPSKGSTSPIGFLFYRTEGIFITFVGCSQKSS